MTRGRPNEWRWLYATAVVAIVAMAALPLAAQPALTPTATLRIEVAVPPRKEHPQVPTVLPVTFWYQIEGRSGQKIEALSDVTKDIQILVSEQGSEITWTAHAPDLPPNGRTATRWSRGGRLRLSPKRVGEVTLKVDAEDLASLGLPRKNGQRFRRL